MVWKEKEIIDYNIFVKPKRKHLPIPVDAFFIYRIKSSCFEENFKEIIYG